MAELSWREGALYLGGFARAIGLDAPMVCAAVALTAYAADGGSIGEPELKAAAQLLERAADLQRMPRDEADPCQLRIPGA